MIGALERILETDKTPNFCREKIKMGLFRFSENAKGIDVYDIFLNPLFCKK